MKWLMKLFLGVSVCLRTVSIPAARPVDDVTTVTRCYAIGATTGEYLEVSGVQLYRPLQSAKHA